MGLLDIDKAELLYAEKVNNVYAPKYYEFNRYYDSGTNYACYKTITDMETETGEYFGNGTNFSLVLMIREASGWKIGGICKCPRDLGSVPAGVTVSRQSYGFVSYQSQPDYIKVKDEKGAVKNVAFSTYLKMLPTMKSEIWGITMRQSKPMLWLSRCVVGGHMPLGIVLLRAVI